jgi:hypothetical protein
MQACNLIFAPRTANCETNPSAPLSMSPLGQKIDLRNEPKRALRSVTAGPENRFAKRTQTRPLRCHRWAKESICETNPTSPFTVSLPLQDDDIPQRSRCRIWVIYVKASVLPPTESVSQNEANPAESRVTAEMERTNRRNSAIVSAG